MFGFDEAMARRIEQAVERCEDDNTIEVVVRVVPASGSYADVAWRWGALGAAIVLAVALYSPIEVGAAWVLPEVAVAGLALGWLAGRSHWMLRLLTRHARRSDQVLQAARAAFVEHAVGATRERTGVMVFASVLERVVLVLPDHGADGAAPRAEWDAIARFGRTHEGELTERVVEIIKRVEVLGDAHLPASEDDNPDELPNRPVIG